MRKELIIAAKIDSTEFDRSIDQLQRKLKDIYSPADTIRMQQMTSQRLQTSGLGQGMSTPTMEAYRRATQQTRRELEQMISQESKGQEKLIKQISERVDKLRALKNEYQAIVKMGREDLELKQRIATMEENTFRLRETYKQRDAALNQMIDARERSRPQGVERLVEAYRGGGLGGAGRAAGRMFMQDPLRIGGRIAAGLGTAVSGGAFLLGEYGQTPIRTEAAMGGAVQGTLGREVQNIYARRTAFEQIFAPERARAAQMALEAGRTTRTADIANLGGNLLGIGGGAAMAMGGGPLGMLVGAGSAVRGAYGLLTDERQRSLALSPFSNRFGQRYESLIAQQLQQNYGAAYEGLQAQNPFRRAAAQEYEQNFMRNLQSQRALGLGNQGFYGAGGFLGQVTGAGFTPEMGLAMQQGILGAGGSTRAARQSAFGLQAERGMGLTNAAQVLGIVSGGMGGAEITKEATVKILAEGMRLGLDDSDFAEENRRFTQVAAEIVARSGAATGADVGRITGGFGQFMAEPTTRGIEAARGAYEAYQQISSATSGPRAVMQAASVLSDPMLSKLSTVEKQAFLTMREEDINEGNLAAVAMADKLGISVDELAQRKRKGAEGAISRFRESDEAAARLRKKGIDISRGAIPSQAEFAKLDEQTRRDIGIVSATQQMELGLDPRQQRAMMQRRVGRPEQFGPGAGEAAVMARLTGETGRMEDVTVKAMAADSSTILKNFNEMAPAMKEAAAASAAWTHQIRELNAALVQALEDARAGKGAPNAVQKILEQMAAGSKPQNQQQAGKDRR